MHAIRLPAGSVELDADLTIPDNPRGIVLFAHGSGSSRHSPRNRKVARALQRAGYATVLMDLLTAKEEQIDQQTIVELNIPTGIPLVYELDDDLKPLRHYYLGDPAAAVAAAERVAQQASAKP